MLFQDPNRTLVKCRFLLKASTDKKTVIDEIRFIIQKGLFLASAQCTMAGQQTMPSSYRVFQLSQNSN